MTALATHHWSGQGQDLLVLLPGAQMRGHEFVDAGFFRLAAEHGLAADVLVVDIDLAGMAAERAAARLTEEVLRPARARHHRLWLGGISLGGLTALLLAADGAVALDGLCLIAPYPGTRVVRNQIARAGGLDAWRPDAQALQDPECRVWHWLQQAPSHLPVFLGHGHDDRFADGMRDIASRLPAAVHREVPGGHEWPVWQTLWAQFLADGALRA